jgi:hypothetical protein
MVQPPATRCSYIAILYVSLVSFAVNNPLCCFSTSVYCCKHIFRYRLSPETFGYALVYWTSDQSVAVSCVSRLRNSLHVVVVMIV